MAGLRPSVRWTSLALALTLAGSLLAPPAMRAGWCDLLFREVAEQAPIVVLAAWEKQRGKPANLRVVEVLRGELVQTDLPISPAELEGLHLKNGDQCLLALDAYRKLIKHVPGIGACHAVNALPLRAGVLRARDREDYDGRRSKMTFEELRADLGLESDS